MSADLLRRAAETLRDKANKATPGEWSYMNGSVMAVPDDPKDHLSFVAACDGDDEHCRGDSTFLRDLERAELAAADDNRRTPIGYTGPVWAEWDVPTRAECDRDEAGY